MYDTRRTYINGIRILSSSTSGCQAYVSFRRLYFEAFFAIVNIMKYRSENGKISVTSIILLVVGVAVIGLLVVPFISNAYESRRLEAEITRVSNETNTKSSSVTCGNVELATICYAEYSNTSSDIKQMLQNSGYDVEITKKGNISATNQSTSVRVDSESTSSETTITLKFKDINVTL